MEVISIQRIWIKATDTAADLISGGFPLGVVSYRMALAMVEAVL